MSSRVSPIDRIRAEIDALFGSGRDLAEVIEDVARLGARLLIQTAVEAEVDEFLGRARYQRRADVADARPGSRNGFCPTTVKTTTGPVTVARPKLRGTEDKFVSRLFGTAVTKTNALETLVIAGFVRGLSVRDVEATLADALGAQASLSKSTVSRVCQAIAEGFNTWRTRRLDELELDYLFCDGSRFKMHQGTRAEPVFAAWGITTAGKPVLVGLEAAGNEGNDAWDGFLDGLNARGLRCSTCPTTSSPDALRDTVRAGVREASGVWWWFLILGILWTGLGMFVLSYRVDSVATVAALVGVALLFGGVGQLVAAARAPGWRWPFILAGILGIVGGISPSSGPT